MGNGKDETKTDVAKWQKPYFQKAGVAANDILGGGFQSYTGNRVAGMSGLENQASTALANYDYGAPQYQQAQDIYSGIANMTPQDYAAMNQQNMNPYQDKVINSMEDVAARRRAQARVGEQIQLLILERLETTAEEHLKVNVRLHTKSAKTKW
jgi:hypothetical protein